MEVIELGNRTWGMRDHRSHGLEYIHYDEGHGKSHRDGEDGEFGCLCGVTVESRCLRVSRY